MEIKTVAVHYERKFNLGDYNSATVGVNLWADLDPEEDNVDECLAELWVMAKDNVKTQSLPLLGADKANVTTPKPAPKNTPPPPEEPLNDWEASADPEFFPTADQQPAGTSAVPVAGKDWGLLEYAPKAADTQPGDVFEVSVNEYKATAKSIAFWRSGAQYPTFTYSMASEYGMNKFNDLFKGWKPVEDDEHHPISPDLILTIVTSDKAKKTGTYYRNLEAVRRVTES